MKINKEHKVEIISGIGAIISALGSSILIYKASNETIHSDILIYELILGILFTILFIVLGRLPLLPKIDESVSKLEKDLMPIIPKINISVENIEQNMSRFEELIKDFISDQQYERISSHINKLQPLSREAGLKILKNYIDRFETERQGFSVQGEQFALNSYVEFWEVLISEQIKRKKKMEQIENISDKSRLNMEEKNMIVRATHSNSISLWNRRLKTESNSNFIETLYNLQEEFIKNGGKIYRILLTRDDSKIPKEELSVQYEAVKKDMEDIGIEVRVLEDINYSEQNYDFLYLHDEKVVLKWFSGVSGKKLSGFEIQDSIDPEVTRNWKNLFNEIQKSGNGFDIDPDREY